MRRIEEEEEEQVLRGILEIPSGTTVFFLVNYMLKRFSSFQLYVVTDSRGGWQTEPAAEDRGFVISATYFYSDSVYFDGTRTVETAAVQKQEKLIVLRTT